MKRSEEHTSELQSPCNLVCRLLLEKKNRDAAQSCCPRRERRHHPRQPRPPGPRCVSPPLRTLAVPPLPPPRAHPSDRRVPSHRRAEREHMRLDTSSGRRMRGLGLWAQTTPQRPDLRHEPASVRRAGGVYRSTGWVRPLTRIFVFFFKAPPPPESSPFPPRAAVPI